MFSPYQVHTWLEHMVRTKHGDDKTQTILILLLFTKIAPCAFTQRNLSNFLT